MRSVFKMFSLSYSSRAYIYTCSMYPLYVRKYAQRVRGGAEAIYHFFNIFKLYSFLRVKEEAADDPDYENQIKRVLSDGKIKSTRHRRKCMKGTDECGRSERGM